jgi:hypothetical protein
MQHRSRKIALILCFALAVAFAGWGWIRPYAWRPAPEARAQIVAAMVTRDTSFYWVHVHLKINPGERHDLEKPVWLETGTGVRHRPADTKFASIQGKEPQELWFKFWLEPQDLAGPLDLLLNDGRLSVKTGSEMPVLKSSTARNFTTNQW